MESDEENEIISPKAIANWADLPLSDDEVFEINLESKQAFVGVTAPDRVTNCCYSLENCFTENAVWLAENIPKIDQFDCVINNSRCFVNYCNKFDDENIQDKLNLLDSFMRLRHDSLSASLMRALHLPNVKTDISFKGKFGINSERTPDFIINGIKNEIIIEVSAVSDPERAYRKKGHMGRGYESKYNKEIQELKVMGLNVIYVVVIFDMSTMENLDHESDVKVIFEELGKPIDKEGLASLDFLRREFITLTNNMFNNYAHLLGILYGGAYGLKKYNDLSHLPIFGEPIKRFNGFYNRVGVSSFLFDKIIGITPRLSVMLERSMPRTAADPRFKLVFEQVNSTFSFKRNQEGPKSSEWEISINNRNYSWLCSNLIVVMRNNEVATSKADFEFLSYEKNRSRIVQKSGKAQNLPDFSTGHSKSLVVEQVSLKDFSNKVNNLDKLNLDCRFEDEDLEQKMISSIMKMDKNVCDEKSLKLMVSNQDVKPLCYYKVDNNAFERAVTSFKEKMLIENDSSGEIPILNHVKPAFIYPLVQIQESDYVDYNHKPKIIFDLKNAEIGPYTDKVISLCCNDTFSFGTRSNELNDTYEKAKLKLSDYHKTILEDLKKLHEFKGRTGYFPRMKELPNYNEHHENLRRLNTNLHDSAVKSGIVNKNVSIVTMGKGKKSQSEIDFKVEMSHFRSKESKAHKKGVGMNFDPVTLSSILKSLKDSLLAPSDSTCPDLLYDETVAKDAKLLVQLKTDIVKSNSSYYQHLRSTNLYHSCAFISRLCHTLMYHSQSSINSTRVVADNLGYDKVLLLIKGGKKIFTTKRSKLFRLFYPTFRACSDLYVSNGLTSSFKVLNVSGRTYMVTPWMNMHETIVADGITFLHRTMGFAILNRTVDISNHDNLDRVFFNIMLAVHNRRQTESMLHNLRYIFMNCMSEVSAIEEILPEIAGFNYDFFQGWIRESLAQNFVEFATEINKLHKNCSGGKNKDISKLNLIHPFNGHKIRDYNTLALGIYSSYLMSKAPTTQLLEQVKNMKNIMSTHEEFMNTKGSTENCFVEFKGDFPDYYSELSESDFNMDPSYCFLLGKFMGDYLMNLEKKSKMVQKWDKILDRPWDEMANTKGLRGKGEDFFGNKGYYVVYKEVLRDDKAFQGIMDIIESDLSSFDKENAINKANEQFRKRVSETELDNIVFHVVDKVQRGGSREIYVMDMETKVHQQIIEDYTKYLCKLVPNEMISIPSNKRLSAIHTKVFEGGKDHSEKYYWVLDCRKWAPKSLIEKFMIFLMGCKGALPETFIVHSLNFFSMMLTKKVYTRQKVVDVLVKSKVAEKYKNYFKFDDSRKGYYFDMPYSWVMGIFNYFSSLVHVANQMHASHLIRVTSQLSFNSENLLHMVAHSDDSAGKILVKNNFEMLRASFIYETLMHSANHLLSKKKCNQGKVYYEFLSILYIGGNLLSLLSKFTGIFNYHPTDKGYCSDITDAYSKSTELLLNGATFEQSYIALKVQSMLIYRFYFGLNISKEYYNLPPAMFGIPDAHPLMSLLCGSDADLFRIFKTGTAEQKKIILCINESLIPPSSNHSGILRSFQCTPRVSLNKKLKDLIEGNPLSNKIANSWTLKNVKFSNTKLNAAQFLLKLKDKAFIASLQDETLTRRLSRSYFFRSHLTVHTSYGDMLPKDIRELIFLINRTINKDFSHLSVATKKVLDDVKELQDFELDTVPFERLFETLYHEVSRLHDYLDKIHYNDSSVVENFKTCKPVYISVQKTTEECPVDYSPSSLCSWIKEPQYRNLLPDTRGYMTAEAFVLRMFDSLDLKIEDVSIDQLFSVLQRIKQRSKSEYFCYSNLPWDLREISTYQDVLNFLSHNSFQNKMIRGLAIQFSKTIGTLIENITADLSDPNLKFSLTLFVLINALMCSPDFQEDMLGVDVNAPDFLGGGVTSLMKLTTDALNYWRSHHSVLSYMQAIMVCVEENIKGNKNFDAAKIMNTYFHCFVKRQMLIDNVWLGQGKLFISLGDLKIMLVINNVRVVQVLLQVHESPLTSSQVSYINICLSTSQLPRLQETMIPTQVEDWGLLGLCYTITGDYYIGDVQGSLRHIPGRFDLNLSTPLSSFDKGRIKTFKGCKMIWEATLDECRHTFHISTLPIETQNSAPLLRGILVDNIKNKRLLDNYDGPAATLLIEICAKELDLERFISADVMMKNYSFTDLFRIIKTCQTRGLATVINPPLRITNIPSPEGGLLNALIQYSKIDPTFDFKWQRHISPEYMSLKASQPESFITEIVDTVSGKYQSLYTDIDKESLHRAISRLTGFDPGLSVESEIMNLLCTWGYVGVAGALEELAGEKKISNFQKVRCYSPSSNYVSLFKDLIFDIAIPLMLIYGKGMYLDDFNQISAFGSDLPINPKNLNYYIMDFVHSIHLKKFTSSNIDRWVYDTRLNAVLCMVSSVLSNPITRSEFSDVISEINVIKNLPVGEKSIKEWQLCIKTLYFCHLENNLPGYDLDYNVRRSLSESIENPYVLTRDTLARYGVKMKSMKLFHYGALSTHHYNLLIKDFKEVYRNQTIWFKMEPVSIEDLYEVEKINYNHKAFPKKKFKADFLDSDAYDEIRLEYQSPEPDCVYIESVLNDHTADEGDPYEKQPLKTVKAVVNGKLQSITRLNLKILFLFGGSINISNLSRLRMLGDEILIVTDQLSIRLLLNEFVQTYQCTSEYWSGNSILNPKGIYYFVISRTIKDIDFWVKVLEAKFVDPESIKIKIGGDYMTIRNNRGALQNENEMTDPSLLWSLVEENLRLKEEEEEKEKQAKQKIKGKGKTIEGGVLGEIAGDFGLEEEQLARHIAKDEAKPVGATIEDLIDLLNDPDIKENVSLKQNDLVTKIKKVVMDPKTAVQHEMIMQAPMIFGGGRSKGKPIKNSIFREKKIIAEVESLCPGLIWKILSGSLYISQETRDFLLDQITAFKMMISHAKEYKKGKQFVLNLCMLMLNDSVVVKNPDDDLITWRQLSSTMLKLMLLDENKQEKTEWTFHEEKEEQGDLRYGVSGESDFNL